MVSICKLFAFKSGSASPDLILQNQKNPNLSQILSDNVIQNPSDIVFKAYIVSEFGADPNYVFDNNQDLKVVPSDFSFNGNCIKFEMSGFTQV